VTKHLACPFCGAYEVERLFVASIHMDSCHCSVCGSAWDEDTRGHYQARGDGGSVLVRRANR
jgi:ribosomal protein L37AE/L43A